MKEHAKTYMLDLCDSCASGLESGEYVAGCAFCDVGLHPHKHLYEFGWLVPEVVEVLVTEDCVDRAARALAAEVGEEDVTDPIVRAGYRESAHKALAAAFDPAYNATVAPTAPHGERQS